MSLDQLKASLPDYARDTKLNLGAVLGTSPLTPQQVWGTALACAITARNPVVTRHIEAEASGVLKPSSVEAAKGAASIMAMNNVYHRGKHLIGSAEYGSLPARLRMQIIGNPGVDKADFELWCLAASAITGCGVCLESHEKAVVAGGLGREAVHEALRIASVIHAAAVTLDAEAALAS